MPPYLLHSGAGSPPCSSWAGCGCWGGFAFLALFVGQWGSLLGTQGGGVGTQSGGPWASDELQVDGLVGHQDDAGHGCHLHAARVRPHLERLDDL